jgi:hypothetical protein
MKKNSLKNSCNAAMRHGLSHKSVRSISNESKGKFKVVLTMAIGLLVLGFATLFVLAH